MIFRPELAAKILAGEKTVTRRRCSENRRSPWWRGECAYLPGRTYAVQPGRTKHRIGTMRILKVHQVRLGTLDEAEAQREGCKTAAEFLHLWLALHDEWLPNEWVWRLEFEVIR